MFCKQCGKPIDDGEELCEECKNGATTATQETTSSSEAYTADPNVSSTQKSKMAAGLLGIFLGAYGVHNFYLGYTGKAIAQLLITLLSCFTLSIVSWVWGLVEGIMILTGSMNTDANGNPLKD